MTGDSSQLPAHGADSEQAPEWTDSLISFRLRHGVVVAARAARGELVEYALLQFLLIAPDFRVEWTPHATLRAGARLGPLDPHAELRPMQPLWESRRIRVTEGPSLDDAKAREALGRADLLIAFDERTLRMVSERLGVAQTAPRSHLIEEGYWKPIHGESLVELLARTRIQCMEDLSGEASTLCECALLASALEHRTNRLRVFDLIIVSMRERFAADDRERFHGC